MTVVELQWLVGISVTVVLAIGGIAIGAFRAMSNRLDRVAKDMQASIRDGDDKLHERVNRVRDEYVRRVDLDGHLARIDKKLDEMQKKQDDQARDILAAITGRQ